jgi:tetratricopeptide (TPR) repeat protein
MVDRDRPPPTAEELEHLSEAFRRDPGRAFLPLGELLLSLGRPREAIDVGARGLKVDPSNLDGRLMVARAFASLHQWREAQAELLKVVKAERQNAAGFRLLGEVLMRRGDYERALPVLQHAQNLDPADPSALALLRLARAGQALAPPPPIPTPMVPARRGVAGGGQGYGRATGRPMSIEQVGGFAGGGPPSNMAGEIETRSPPTVREGGGAFIAPPQPPGYDPMAMRTERDGAPPPMHGAPTVRPRVIPIEKPRDAAQASLRQSAAVGEHYLNNLLVGGLLDVPRVSVPEASFDLASGRRWGRSTMRLFVYLFVLLFAGIAGAGTWFWYTEKQRSRDVVRHVDAARVLVDSGDHAQLAQADGKLRAAISRDRENSQAVALLAHVGSLELLLYGELTAGEVGTAIDLASQSIRGAGQGGFRELVLARMAHGLALLPTLEEGADSHLADARAELDRWLSGHPDDGLARWLEGQARWAAGDRSGAEAAFEQADRGGEGPVLAAISLADLRLDDGKFDDAGAIYDRALSRSPKHPWALIGRSLARSERSEEIGEAVADLNVRVAGALGPRVGAAKALALATALLAQEDYKAFAAELDKATGVSDPRFLARVGLLRMQQGKLVEAAKAREAIRWYADRPQPDPLLVVLDAQLYLASGLARQALDKTAQVEGLRPSILRGRALFDLGRAGEALVELEDARKIAPEDLELQAWAEAARLVAGDSEERKKADEALNSLGRKAKSKAVRVPHGVALAAIGRRAQARDKLDLALRDMTDEYPNPLAYRAHVVLAEIDLADGKTESALAGARRALELNAGYLPVHDLLCRITSATDPAAARPHCLEVAAADVASPGAELGYARAIWSAADPEARKTATEALKRALQKGANQTEVQATAAALDPALPDQLGLATTPKKPQPKRRRRR